MKSFWFLSLLLLYVSPSGHLVDGLPLVLHKTHADTIGFWLSRAYIFNFRRKVNVEILLYCKFEKRIIQNKLFVMKFETVKILTIINNRNEFFQVSQLSKNDQKKWPKLWDYQNWWFFIQKFGSGAVFYSTCPPSGYLVDGLPLDLHTHAETIGFRLLRAYIFNFCRKVDVEILSYC